MVTQSYDNNEAVQCSGLFPLLYSDLRTFARLGFKNMYRHHAIVFQRYNNIAAIRSRHVKPMHNESGK